MKLSEKGIEALHKREGLRLKPYLDTQGVPTIAMGNTYYLDGKKVTMKDKALTVAQASELAEKVANDFAVSVSSKIIQKLTQDQFDALVSIAYNIGKGAFAGSTFLKYVNVNPNNPAIAKHIMAWTKNKELVGRRFSEVEQYFTGIPEVKETLEILKKQYGI